MDSITVGLVLEHRMFADALTSWFQRKAPDRIQLVATATGEQLLWGDLGSAAVIITDRPCFGNNATTNRPTLQGLEAVIVLVVETAQEEDPDYGRNVRAYVAPGDEVGVLIEAVSTVLTPQRYYSPHVLDLLEAEANAPTGAVILTVKQRRVLDLYVSGMQTREVAEILGSRPNTIVSQLKTIRAKFRTAGIPASSKIDLVRAALIPTGIKYPRQPKNKSAAPDPLGGSAHATRPILNVTDPPNDVLRSIPPKGDDPEDYRIQASSTEPRRPGNADFQDDDFWDQFPDILTTNNLSTILQLPTATIYRRLADGAIPGYLVQRSWIVFKSEVHSWLTSISTSPPAPVDVLSTYDDTMLPKDLMDLLDKSKPTIYHWIESGVIPAYNISNHWIIRKFQLRQALSEYSNQSGEWDSLTAPSAVDRPAAT